MLICQGVSYTHSNRNLLFSDLDLVVNKHDKIALVGNNGAGKSTLLKLMAGELVPSNGTIKAVSKPYYVPQTVSPFNTGPIARALGVETKLQALKAILDGNVSAENMNILGDD